MQKKIIITLTVIIGAIYALVNANIMLNFRDINIQSFKDKFSLIHFTAPGNNFVGSIFRLPSKSLSGTTITLNKDTKTCTKQLRGLYFNSQRGNRLRPLDSETLDLLKKQNVSYDDLSIEGGLYTTCEKTNPYNIFGAITYVRKGMTGYLVAGTRLDYKTNKITARFAKSLQYFDNKVPIGYLYDSNGGIGFVGGSLTGHEKLINFLNNGGSINSGFRYSGDMIISNTGSRTATIKSGNNAMETMRNLIIQGSVELSKSINETDRLSLLGNLQNKTVIYNGNDINSSTLINFAKQKAQQLCQGKKPYTERTLSIDPEKIICIQEHDLIIDLSKMDTYKSKTIIVKSGNVILQGGMEATSPSLDLFIDKGLLHLPKDEISYQSFNDQGYPGENGISSGLYLKGNFIINGLIVGPDDIFTHKLHLQGKITTLNTPLTPNEGRINQIESMFGGSTYNSLIGLQKVFTRSCQLNGIGSDKTLCNTGGIISTTPLVILNGNYPSNILQ